MQTTLSTVLLFALTTTFLYAQLPETGTLDSTSAAADTSSVGADSALVSAALLLSGVTAADHERFMAKWRIVTGAALEFRARQGTTDLDFIRQSRPYSLSKEELQQFAPPRDFVAEELYRRQTGTVPPLNLNPLFQGLPDLATKAVRAGRRPSRIPEIPSPIEADILVALWQNGPATRGDVYATLDTTWRLTAQDLDALLNEMVDKGLLARKKISPENTLSISTPLGVFSVEKSTLNRRNENYLYWPIVDRRKLMTYLDAQLYLASITPPATGNGRALAYHQTLLETLYRLSAAASP